ncbi:MULTISPECIES: MPN499 family protein [unclassified Mycoplasma]|uniref:MPN499 family protein n=1 Tax=unclassified Mycoplasma TaxID=2683645 RepID=UPI00211B83A0|nr:MULTISPECIES: hypothetical protein [unclassified Mycoplasma]UUM19545.1 hypothetical protein NPA11_02080 [Mycoplasma sp. 1578d]UUM24464.1 hypothetical protein NPA12_02055 [Mycoplasma sp. 3686d]
MRHVRRVKINNMDNGFWLVPSIQQVFTPKSRNFAIKHAWTLFDLIEKNGFEDEDIIFSFNGDPQFQIFNSLLQYRGYDFELPLNKIKQMNDNQYIDWEVISNLTIRFNFKTIKTIYSGYIFFFRIKHFEYLYTKHKQKDDKVVLEWTRFGFHAI